MSMEEIRRIMELIGQQFFKIEMVHLPRMDKHQHPNVCLSPNCHFVIFRFALIIVVRKERSLIRNLKKRFSFNKRSKSVERNISFNESTTNGKDLETERARSVPGSREPSIPRETINGNLKSQCIPSVTFYWSNRKETRKLRQSEYRIGTHISTWRLCVDHRNSGEWK